MRRQQCAEIPSVLRILRRKVGDTVQEELIYAVDPGNEQSGYAIFRADSLKPIEFGKIDNEQLLEKIAASKPTDELAIEMIASYGMAVGASVFDTCVWTGRFIQAFNGNKVTRIFRREEKMHICHSPNAKDSNIRVALIDRFAEHDKVGGKGTKKDPDFFYGFKADCWAAFAVGLTYIETRRGKTNEQRKQT